MIDFSGISEFDWDSGNSRKSSDKHGVSPAETEQMFVNKPLVVAEDTKHSAKEKRFQALGKTGNSRLLHVTFTLRRNATLIRIISARDMNRKEREIYQEASHDKET